MTRRSLFKRLGAFVAVIALAPEIAFSAKLPIPAACEPPKIVLDIEGLMRQCYEIAHKRQADGNYTWFYTDRSDEEIKAHFPNSVIHRLPEFRPTIGIYEQLRSAS